ncbi:MAG: Ribonuclease [Candidatus Parcubacteria bacterium]|jgi:ribonuclease P protein component
MLKKAERIPRGQFETIFKTGKRLHVPLCQLVYQVAPGPAFSVVVSKKVAKQAVVRNRLRRQVYGVVERYLREDGGVVKVAGIFLLKPTSPTPTRAQVAAAISDLLAQINKSR